MISHEELIGIIRQCQAEVEKWANLLRLKFSEENLLAAWKNRSLPAEGDLESGVSFCFHGAGCAIDDHGRLIDFDFGLGGTTGGFDLWRLKAFVEARPDKYGELLLLDLERAFGELAKAGVIERSDRPPSVGLYYLGTPKKLPPIGN